MIVIHIRMLDGTAQAQQEAVGVLGINLIHAAFYMGGDSAAIIGSLLSELSRSRIEVSPPAHAHALVNAQSSYWVLVKTLSSSSGAYRCWLHGVDELVWHACCCRWT